MAPLEILGMVVQGTRLKRGLTQERAARAAGVSRKQWALLEKGENVSVVFLRKVARSLGLDSVPLGEELEGSMTGGASALHVPALLHLCDEMLALVERMRILTFDAVLPPSERTGDAAAISAFLENREQLSAADAARLNRSLQRFTSDVAAAATPANALAKPAKSERQRSKRRA
ncbi:MAG TPA: helix-turn-helix domain-containing protein [Thermoanaerobaculia bacterium]|nr:helix-turn-helix domain-containing protein [Thermoanaerobaculia bacterium]